MPPEETKLRIIIPEQTVEWTITNFKTAIRKDILQSQVFHFSRTRVFLKLMCVPNTGSPDDKITLNLLATDFSKFDPKFGCRLGIKKPDGSVFNSFRGVEIRSRVVTSDFLPMSEILKAAGVMSAGDPVTFICTLSRAADGGKKDAACQTMSPVGHASDAAKGTTSSEYVGAFAESFKELCLSGLHSDVTIKIEDVEFPVHKCILSARSSVFASTFLREVVEKSGGVVDVSDCDASCFEVFLLFLYTGDASYVTAENAVRLYRIAVKYKTADLEKASVQIMKGHLRVETICDVVQLAVMHDELELLRLATDFFINNCVTILTTPSWKDLLVESPSTANELFLQFAKKHSRRE